jgi:hypothetical protein
VSYTGQRQEEDRRQCCIVGRHRVSNRVLSQLCNFRKLFSLNRVFLFCKVDYISSIYCETK